MTVTGSIPQMSRGRSVLEARALRVLGLADTGQSLSWTASGASEVFPNLRDFPLRRPPAELIVVTRRADGYERLGAIALVNLLADAAGADLAGCDLSGLDLTGADLECTYAPGCDFWGTSLRRANLAGATVARCQFGGADLSFARFDDADCRESDFHGAETYGATFARSDMRGAHWDHVPQL